MPPDTAMAVTLTARVLANRCVREPLETKGEQQGGHRHQEGDVRHEPLIGRRDQAQRGQQPSDTRDHPYRGEARESCPHGPHPRAIEVGAGRGTGIWGGTRAVAACGNSDQERSVPVTSRCATAERIRSARCLSLSE